MVRRTVVAFALLGALLVSTPPAAADTRAERDKARRERAEAARDLDAMKAEASEVDAALEALEAQAAAAEAELHDAEAALAAAHAAKANAEAAEQRAKDEVAASKRVLVDLAIGEFIDGGSLADRHVTITAQDPAARARQGVLASLAVGTASDAEDQLQAAHEDLAIARDEAIAAADAARERQALVAEQAASAAAARDQQGAFASKLHDRIESRLAEAAALADVDRTLSAKLAQEQAALAARTPRVTRSASSTVVRGGSVPLRTVRGITVHADIADNVAALVDAAAADGIDLGGGGYRDPSDQQRLREAHCPDPQSSPASECRPPTARPGHSMHERGLAIDFTSGGSLITTRRSAAFQWLAAHASSYGLYNLPEEPWHWSTNGD